MNPTTIEEPKGIPFYSVKTGETHFCKLEPTISAYINSSDMGINASRGQDYGWRLAPDWVKKVRAFKRDRTSMSILTAKNDGRKPTTTQILYYMYGEELANYYEEMEENENPFEEAYLAAINSGLPIEAAIEESGMPKALADFRAVEDDDDMADLIDDVLDEDEDAGDDAPTTGVDLAEKGGDKTVETTTEPAEKPATRSQKKQ